MPNRSVKQLLAGGNVSKVCLYFYLLAAKKASFIDNTNETDLKV